MRRLSDVTSAQLPMRTGRAMPQVGLGVWQAASGAETKQAVLAAFRLGYRHVDTAKLYGNEADVGAAVRECGLPREELFITTKLWNSDHGYDRARRAFDASLTRLGLDYVDLYLIHWPVAGQRKDSWRALEAIAREGRAKAVGVSNYLVPHLEELLASSSHVPAANQIELHPFLQQRETRAFCKKHGIVVQAYSPLMRGNRLDHPALKTLAKATSRTPAQVVLRWGIQHGHAVLPKSVREARLRENGALFDFELDPAAMATLDALDEGANEAWDPRDQD